MRRKKANPLQRLLKKSVSDFNQNLENFLVDTLIEVTPEPLKEFVESSFDRRQTGREAEYRDRLAAKLKGKIEVQTPDGRIDVLTKKEVIEVKCAPDWKHGLGQVLAYSKYYPSHQKRLHLYGEVTPQKLRQIKQQCQSHEVAVTWEK
uniref:hypothetical protein n=1 Tax=Trichocoleus desertorum TaxID=1481672 RepID=UPI0025B4A1E5|nr:hypothetical protein [Trichocoleus desertorum]